MESAEKKDFTSVNPMADFAKGFLENRFTEYPLLHEGDKTRIYRIFEREISFEGFPNIKFVVDYREPMRQDNFRPTQLRFEYIPPSEKNVNEKPVAEMHFDVLSPHHFVLVHRYVKPELRGEKGLGTRLFEASEPLLQQIALLSNEKVQVDLNSGQQSVIKWALARGFEMDEKQRSIYEEILQHPERFVEDEVIISQISQDNNVVKAPYTFRTTTKGRYMEDAIRVKLSKEIIPAQK